MKHIKKSSGFTLAEVLITLGVLGIVASWTLPPLVKNYQKIQYMSALQKSVSTLQDGFKNYMAEQDLTFLSDTALFASNDFFEADRQTVFDAFIKKYFKTIATVKAPDSNSDPYFYYQLKWLGKNVALPKGYFYHGYAFSTIDGMIYSIDLEETSSCAPDRTKVGGVKAICGSILMDVTGKAGPNQWGRDVFYFLINYDGSLFPAYGTQHAQFVEGTNWQSYGSYWKNWTASCGAATSTDVSNTLGYCAGRIVDEGWIMRY